MHENADISHMILQCMTVIYNFLVFRKIKWMAISIALHGSSSLCSTIIWLGNYTWSFHSCCKRQ